jgi:hypothetical protein
VGARGCYATRLAQPAPKDLEQEGYSGKLRSYAPRDWRIPGAIAFYNTDCTE